MPSTVKIGPFVYNLMEKPGPLVSGGKICDACIDYAKLEIEVEDVFKASAKQANVMHEVVHAIERKYMVNFTDLDRERICDVIGQGILALIKENPEFVKWLASNED